MSWIAEILSASVNDQGRIVVHAIAHAVTLINETDPSFYGPDKVRIEIPGSCIPGHIDFRDMSEAELLGFVEKNIDLDMFEWQVCGG